MFAFLDRDRSIAPAGYSRWLAPPAALAIHLAIGQVYSFSVFKAPLIAYFTATVGTGNINKDIGYIFSVAIAVLGLSAALFGAWLEKAGPRRAMFYAAICFGAGFEIASLGIKLHQLPLIYLGYHGLRRRRDDRESAGEPVDGAFQGAGRAADSVHLDRHGHFVLRVHDVWRVYDSRAARGVEA
jgi:hypothetical protein